MKASRNCVVCGHVTAERGEYYVCENLVGCGAAAAYEIDRLKTAAAIAINLIDDGTPQAAAKSLRRRVFNDGPVPTVYA